MDQRVSIRTARVRSIYLEISQPRQHRISTFSGFGTIAIFIQSYSISLIESFEQIHWKIRGGVDDLQAMLYAFEDVDAKKTHSVSVSTCQPLGMCAWREGQKLI